MFHLTLKVGDRVRVKSSIITPKHNWGGHVTHKSVGVVKGKICVFLSKNRLEETLTTLIYLSYTLEAKRWNNSDFFVKKNNKFSYAH